VAQVVEPSKHKTLSSNPSTIIKKKEDKGKKRQEEDKEGKKYKSSWVW
jgi:hypothetical protein